MKPVAFVIPWFGESLKGGAEQQAWQAATRLAARGHAVEVLTTCCRSFLEDWSTNHLKEGAVKQHGLVIRRFKADKRNGELFNRANNHGLSVPPGELLPGVNPFTFGMGEQFVSENINSSSLERYLKRNRENYCAFIFIPYLYGVILNGLPLVADRAWLQPCLHDEVYAYLPEVDAVMRTCRGILYNSRGEERLALQLYGPGIMRKGEVVGEGIEVDRLNDRGLPSSVAGLDLEREKYVLCLGRRGAEKNTPFLVQAYQQYRASHPDSGLKLVVAGPGEEVYGAGVQGVHDLGFVPEGEKAALLLHCAALFQPSRNESYSRVIMEAWFREKPVAAHRACLATAMAVDEAGGGWTAEKPYEWAALFHKLNLAGQGELRVLGQRGREYAGTYAQWDAVIDRYETILGLTSDRGAGKARPRIGSKEIHQLTPGFAYGDAISNQALAVRDLLRRRGYNSEIFTEHIDPTMTHEAHLFGDGRGVRGEAGLIYHHSIGAGLTDFVISHPGPKGLIYHNITPPGMVREADPRLADMLELGIRDLPRLAPHFKVSAGDSHFNSLDLEKAGFVSPSVFPICIAPEKWNIPADPNMMRRLSDGRDNILFVGRIIGNKRQHDLIDAFAEYAALYGNARLILVGGYIEEEKYYQALREKIRSRGLEGDVFFTGKIADSTLHSCYRCADLFWSMSEHEGFGVPLIEAMWFDVPVFAYKSSAVPETMGEGGLLFTDKEDMQALAVTARLMIHDPDLRAGVLAGQQRRRLDFLPEVIEPLLDAFLKGMAG